MKPAPTLRNEQQRLEALLRYGMLDTEADQAFDDLVHLATHACNVTMASISFLDRDREWLKAKTGRPDSEWSGDRSWCAHPNLHQPRVIVPNTLADHRFPNHPMVMGASFVRFYAGKNRSRRKSCWTRLGRTQALTPNRRPPDHGHLADADPATNTAVGSMRASQGVSSVDPYRTAVRTPSGGTHALSHSLR